jgi:membrane protein required for beta-lactamase induction
MEQERNVIGAATSVLFSGMIDFIAPLKWFALLGFVLIIADLRFGVRAAKVRGEKIRISRAGRRTINKLVDYMCWVFLAAAINKAIVPHFDMPLLPAFVLLVVYGFEINSCYSNYFEARGKKFKIDIFKIFKKKIDIIEIEEEKNETTN